MSKGKTSKMPVHAVRLTTKGDIVGAQITPNAEGTFGIEDAQTYFGKKSIPQVVAHYNYKDTILYIIGYPKGKAGTENRTALSKPYDKTVLYGDALVIASKSQKIAKEGPIEQLMQFNVGEFKLFQEEALTVAGKSIAVAQAETVAAVEESDEEELAEFDDEDDDSFGSEEDEKEAEAEVEVEPEADDPPMPKRKKKVIQTQILSGYQKQSQLIVQEGHDELHPDSPSDVSLRQICVERFAFLKDFGLTETDVTQFENELFLATLTEAATKHIFAHWKNPLFQEIHTYRQFRLFSNLHPKSPVGNRRLLKRVQEGELKMADLARLEDMELYPENWKRLQDQQLVREQKWLEGNKMVATDMFKCNRCGKKETTYYEMQTRSADEPMTIFITCVNCGKKWKQ